MMGIPFRTALTLANIFVFTCAGVYLYYWGESLFANKTWAPSVKKQIMLALILFCFYMALMPFYPGTQICYYVSDFFDAILQHFFRSAGFLFLPLAIILYIKRTIEIKNVPPVKQQVIIIASIFIFLISTHVAMRLLIGDIKGNALIWTFLFSLFISAMLSMIYLTITYTQLALKRKQFEKELEISRLNELKTKAELEALQAKINPHFLYNTLNSIAELSVSQGLKARNMTIALADLFRYSLNKRSEAEITIEQEIEMVENYLLIEKIRFEDKLDVVFDIDDSARLLLIPKFILQPLVENAIKHGTRDPDVKRAIQVTIRADAKTLDITIGDNGGPFPENIQMGYGLKNMSDKMTWLYPGNHTIYFENLPRKQVVISITNPLKNGAVI